MEDSATLRRETITLERWGRLKELRSVAPTAPRSVGPKVSSPDSLIGRVLSHYRLEEPLGVGGMGVVYRATDLKLGRAVAIKILSRQLASDKTAKARFMR